MHISKVSLVNYRNFKNAEFIFRKGTNTIIGENGSGKSNVFRAMRLLLDGNMVQQANRLDEDDFNRTIGDWRGHWIIISIQFDEIDPDEAIQSLFVHGSGDMKTSKPVTKATYNLYFRPKSSVRSQLAELKLGDKVGLKKILDSLTIREHYESVYIGKSTADFSDLRAYTELVGDFDKVIFPAEMDQLKFGIRIPPQLSIARELSFTFIQALRDVVSDFHSNRTNPLLTLLKRKSEEIKESDYEAISQKIKDLNEAIEKLDDVQDIRKDIHDTMKEAVGENYALNSLSIQSGLSEETDRLLQSLKLFISEPGDSKELAIHELSLGGANLIFLTLKLLEYKYSTKRDTFANFLVIEEPEAHIHTHIQKTLFDKVNFDNTQIIYSTHSTYISEVCNIESMNILARKGEFAEVYQPAKSLDSKQVGKLARYLDSVRSNLLFAKGVILVEGDSEEILIPILVKKVFGITLDELGISLINIRSTGFENVSCLFHNERIRRKCAIITDSDAAIVDITIEEDDSEDVIYEKKSAAKAEELGEERKKKIDEISKDNDWIKGFYADHTFEIDFVPGNETEIIDTLPEVYLRSSTRDIAEEEIDNIDIKVYGKRILTIANHIGKGWFAVLLSDKVSFSSIIPEYIVKAIVFAKHSFSKALIRDIVLYRVKKYDEINTDKAYKDMEQAAYKYATGSVKLKELKEKYERTFSTDSCWTFLNQFKT